MRPYYNAAFCNKVNYQVPISRLELEHFWCLWKECPKRFFYFWQWFWRLTFLFISSSSISVNVFGSGLQILFESFACCTDLNRKPLHKTLRLVLEKCVRDPSSVKAHTHPYEKSCEWEGQFGHICVSNWCVFPSASGCPLWMKKKLCLSYEMHQLLPKKRKCFIIKIYDVADSPRVKTGMVNL